jgi:hypothetical protein
MPAERVSMRRVREILRLKFECGRSDRAIAVAVSVARSTVGVMLNALGAAIIAAKIEPPLPASARATSPAGPSRRWGCSS